MDVVLLGDSIIEHLNGNELGVPDEAWQKQGRIFSKLFSRQGGGGEIDGMALGIDGDQTGQLLYRLQNGEMASSLNPQVWWVLIGSFNLDDRCSAEATLAGIVAIIEELRQQRPNATIVINSILPRPRNHLGTLAGILWMKSEWINTRLECYSSGLPHVEYFDATSIFVNKAGDKLLKDHYEDDWLHPSATGTEEWGEAIVAKVKELVLHGCVELCPERLRLDYLTLISSNVCLVRQEND